MYLLFPLTKGHLSNVATISWQIAVALLERDYCIFTTATIAAATTTITIIASYNYPRHSICLYRIYTAGAEGMLTM